MCDYCKALDLDYIGEETDRGGEADVFLLDEEIDCGFLGKTLTLDLLLSTHNEAQVPTIGVNLFACPRTEDHSLIFRKTIRFCPFCGQKLASKEGTADMYCLN